MVRLRILLPVITPLLSGGSVAFPRNALQIDLSEWLGGLKPTWYSAAPTLHLAILQRMESQGPRKIVHSLRFALTGGALLPHNLHEKLQIRTRCASARPVRRERNATDFNQPTTTGSVKT